jgi:hypothetical protein
MKSAMLTLIAGSLSLYAGTGVAQTMPANSAAGTDTGNAARSSFSRDRNISVTERPHPEYDAIGIPAGGFRLFPKLTVGVISDDNIFVDETNTVDDTIFRTQAEINARSNWSRHRLNGFARILNAAYSDYDDEGYTDYQVGGSGQIDVQRDFSIEGGGDIGKLTEPRTDNNSPDGVTKPIRYDKSSLDVQAVKSFNRVRLLGRIDWTKLDYKNGVNAAGNQVFQDGRDRDVTAYTLRSEYAVSPDTALFAEAVFNNRDYDFTSPLNGATRTSSGSEISIGANFDLSNLVRGEVQVGYVEQNYDYQALSDIDAVSGHARLEWFPTQLITVRLDAGRSIEDATGLGISGYLATTWALGADYEVQRNVILSARYTGEKDDYAGVDREDDKWTAELGGTYKVNRTLSVKAEYEHLNRDSDVVGGDYKIDRFGLTLIVQR